MFWFSATWCILPDSFQEETDRKFLPLKKNQILPSQGIMFSLFGDVLARRLAWIPEERRVSGRGDEQSVSRTGQPRSWWRPAQRSLPAKVVVAWNDRWGSRIPGWLPAGEQAPQSTSKNVRRRLQRSTRDTVHEFYQWPHEHHRYCHINPIRRYPGGKQVRTRVYSNGQSRSVLGKITGERVARTPKWRFLWGALGELTEYARCGRIDCCSESEQPLR